jgi:ribosomal protein S4
MSIHKLKKKKKIYIKAGLFTNLKKHKALTFKSQTLRFFSPDFSYLNSKTSNKIKDSYQTSFINRKKLKLLFGFHRTALLNRFLKKELLKNKTSQYSLKENEFCSLLERRLDVLLFRLGFAKTLFEAKHLIAHKKICVNGNVISSYTKKLNKGDIISFVPSAKSLILKRLLDELKARDFFFNTFDNLEINYKTLKIIVLNEKINFSKQIQHYSFLLNWKSILNG